MSSTRWFSTLTNSLQILCRHFVEHFISFWVSNILSCLSFSTTPTRMQDHNTRRTTCAWNDMKWHCLKLAGSDNAFINYAKSKVRATSGRKSHLGEPWTTRQLHTYTLKFFLRTGTRKNTVIYMSVATNELTSNSGFHDVSTFNIQVLHCKLSRYMSTTKFLSTLTFSR